MERIIDYFGREEMSRMVGRDTGPRMAALLVDRNVRETFGGTIRDIPEAQRDTWIDAFIDCGRTDPFVERGATSRQGAQNLVNMLRFTYQEREIPPYRYVQQANAAYDRFDAYLADGFDDLPGGLEGYLGALRRQEQVEDELAIIRPSERAEVTDLLEQRRDAILSEFVAAEQARIADVETSVEGIGNLVAAAEGIGRLRGARREDEPAFRGPLADYVDASRETTEEILEPMDPEAVLATTEQIFGIIAGYFQSTDTPLRRRRGEALDVLASGLEEELAATETSAEIAAIKTGLRGVLAYEADAEWPSIRDLNAATAERSEEIRASEYRAGCMEYLAGLEVDEEAAGQGVIVSGGTVPFWQFVCAMRDRGAEVSSFSEPGLFSSIYTMEMTSSDGDFMEIKMKEASVGGGEEAFVGQEYANAVESEAFTLQSWKEFVSGSAGL